MAEKGGDEREWKEEKIGRRKYTQSRENMKLSLLQQVKVIINSRRQFLFCAVGHLLHFVLALLLHL